jgi:hypothetical protein
VDNCALLWRIHTYLWARWPSPENGPNNFGIPLVRSPGVA